MIDEEICKLRNKLNNSIVSGEDYDKIYRLSVELDELIAEYYTKEKARKKSTKGSSKEKLKILA